MPESIAEPVVDVMHGVAVQDPYRWLEDQESPRTRRWIDEQTDYARGYFDSLQDRGTIRDRISELLSVETYDRPIEINGRTFFLKREPHQQQPSICVRLGADGEDRVLVDPSLRGEGSTTAVQVLAVSKGARMLAYGVKHGGEDTMSVEFIDVETGIALADRLSCGVVRGLSFTPDGSGLVYSHRAVEGDHEAPFCIRRHRFGTAFDDDDVILSLPHHPSIKGIAVLTSGGSLMMFIVSRLAGNERVSDFFLHDCERGEEPRVFAKGIAGGFAPRFAGGRLFAVTTDGAPNSRIVEVPVDSGSWREIVPQSSRRVKNFAVVAGTIYVVYAADDHTPLEAYSLAGHRLPAPELSPGTITSLWSHPASEIAFLEFTSFTCPRTIYRIDAKGMKLWRQRQVPFDPAGIEVRRVWFRSKDGTRVPMFLIGKDLDSSARPTVLSAYGGFGTTITPQFTAYGTFLLEQGCTLAIANIRGGSEFGVEWHEAAKREKRQKAFDDFFAAAESLIDSGHTTPAMLGIVGGSNAGLLVGVAITQRPKLFHAAVCLGPLLDMVRYHRFGNARFWVDEYGCAEHPAEFQYLYAYSPYHRIRDGEKYPAVLLISGDEDKRCDASHARKMAARLQQATASELPILLDYQSCRGHSPVLPLKVRIEGLTDRIAFLCDQLGVRVRRVGRDRT
jgi:prolyl oligopeptidase